MRWALVGFALAACSRGVVDDPFVGEAYPRTSVDIALPSAYAIVPSSGADQLTIVDLEGAAPPVRVPVGRVPVLLDGPTQVVVDAKKSAVYVLDAYPEGVEGAGNHSHGSSKRSGWVQGLALGTLLPVSEARVDPNPGEIALSEDGKRLVVSHFDLAAAKKQNVDTDARRSTLAVLDPAEMKPFGTPEADKLLVCAAPHGLALSRPRGDRAFVACYGEDAIAFVNLDDPHQPVHRVPIGAAPNEGQPRYGPYGLALSPDGKWLAASMRLTRDLVLVDVEHERRSPTVYATAGEPYVAAWSADGKKLYLPTRGMDAFAIIDVESGRTENKRLFDRDTCVAPTEAIVLAQALLVLCEGDARANGVVLTLDSTTLEVKKRVDVGPFPGRPFVGHR